MRSPTVSGFTARYLRHYISVPDRVFISSWSCLPIKCVTPKNTFIKFMRKSPLWTNEQMRPGPRTSADLGVLKINGVGSVCWKSQFIKNAWQEITMRTLWNHVRSGRNGRRFVDDIFWYIFFNENVQIAKRVSLKCILWILIDDDPAALVRDVAWCRQATSHNLKQC